MDRRPIDPRIEPDAPRGDAPADGEGGHPAVGGHPAAAGRSAAGGVTSERFREALAEWATTVTVVAVRDGGDVHGVTVTSFAPVAAEPPLVVVSLGPGAKVVPFIEVGGRFVVSLLAEGQDRIASVLADTFPVGPSPFPAEGDPVVEGCVLALVCTAEKITEAGAGARLVVGRVQEVRPGGGGDPLLYQRRAYRRLQEEES